MKSLTTFIVHVLCTSCLFGTTLHVGEGQTFPDPATAALSAVPGDTIFIHVGSYGGTFWIENLNGTESAPITIMGESEEQTVFDGGTESVHFSDCSYLQIENFTVTGQTGNGMNIDDGGTMDTPTHHIKLERITFRTMNATGNNDMLKLSGLEDFEIRECSFSQGSAGGSGIDMVGCHRGLIMLCGFQDMGSNAIQAKGGTQHIRIERNRFVNAGARGINLGGSTGLDFFRPHNAPFEAADLQVYANIFDGSQAPVAYVGSVRVDVANNLIRNPGKWIFRILQETTEPEGRFVACGQNLFRNNIILYSSENRPTVNIGPNTDAASFTVTHNVCYDGSGITTSPLAGYPFTDERTLVGINPLISTDCPSPASPVLAAGVVIPTLTVDFFGKRWGVPPSIGACEQGNPTSIGEDDGKETLDCLTIKGTTTEGMVVDVHPSCSPLHVELYNVLGQMVLSTTLYSGSTTLATGGQWCMVHVTHPQDWVCFDIVNRTIVHHHE